MIDTILKKIKTHTLKVGIIGVGYIGLPMAIEMAKKNNVIAFDTDIQKINALKQGKSYIDDICNCDVELCVNNQKMTPTADECDLEDVGCYIVCVPTPLNINKQPELKYIISAAETIASHLNEGDIVVFESTTYPGTTEELVRPILEKTGLYCDKDFFLAFSPERVDPGNTQFKTSNTAKVVGGTSKEATEIVSRLYEENLNCDVFKVSSPTVAEMSKILENTYRNINIGLIDEFAMICNKMGIDIWEVIDAAKTKPFGFQAFYPGPGVGGHCIPLDPLYLSWKVKEYGISATMIEASGRIIDYMPNYVVERMLMILNENGQAINGSRILIVGVAYKANISDYRESPAIHIIKKLKLMKAHVDIYDPFVVTMDIDGVKYTTIHNLENISNNYDLIVVLVNHSGVEYRKLVESNIPIFDSKNVLKDYDYSHIVRL